MVHAESQIEVADFAALLLKCTSLSCCHEGDLNNLQRIALFLKGTGAKEDMLVRLGLSKAGESVDVDAAIVTCDLGFE